MGRRIMVLVLALVVGLFAYLGYNSYDAKRAGLSGDVFSNDTSGGKAKIGSASQPAASAGGPAVVSSPPAVETPPAAQTSPPTAEAAPDEARTTRDGIPEDDSIGPNPPDGKVFSGAGKYQLYRQGNLTWRMNTETGKSCILFATDKEWKKPKVYQAGCGSR